MVTYMKVRSVTRKSSVCEEIRVIAALDRCFHSQCKVPPVGVVSGAIASVATSILILISQDTPAWAFASMCLAGIGAVLLSVTAAWMLRDEL